MPQLQCSLLFASHKTTGLYAKYSFVAQDYFSFINVALSAPQVCRPGVTFWLTWSQSCFSLLPPDCELLSCIQVSHKANEMCQDPYFPKDIPQFDMVDPDGNWLVFLQLNLEIACKPFVISAIVSYIFSVIIELFHLLELVRQGAASGNVLMHIQPSFWLLEDCVNNEETIGLTAMVVFLLNFRFQGHIDPTTVFSLLFLILLFQSVATSILPACFVHMRLTTELIKFLFFCINVQSIKYNHNNHIKICKKCLLQTMDSCNSCHVC